MSTKRIARSKRALDVALTAPVFVGVLPLIAGLAALVRLLSPGPAFFVQERVGQHKKPLRMVKLRTMVQGAERLGAHVTAQGDTRTTLLGRALRKTKLDELPQLWLVLRGEMSLIGPRPEVPRYVAHYRPEWDRVFSVPPGITDLASLVFRNEEALLARVSDRERAYVDVILPRKLALALRDIDASSITHDLYILLRTALAVIGVRNVTEEALLEEVRRALARFEAQTSEQSRSAHGARA